MNDMKPDEDELETNSRIIAILKSEVSVHDSFHGTLSSTLAEERLKNAKEARCYLTRISDKKGCLILSYQVSQSVVKHLLTVSTRLLPTSYPAKGCLYQNFCKCKQAIRNNKRTFMYPMRTKEKIQTRKHLSHLC